jgi:hypothetical protein
VIERSRAHSLVVVSCPANPLGVSVSACPVLTVAVCADAGGCTEHERQDGDRSGARDG